MIEFYLNSEKVQEDAIASDITLLRYLRTQKQLVGTKEGCGSGDCGACTVLVGELREGEWRYRSVNACITFLAQVHHKSIITVEGLMSDGQLHPAQQAMVDKHGSQCGFCTPGIVMSLTALFERSPTQSSYSLPEIYDALSGNLCRCTGYKPIIDAAQAMKHYPTTAAVGLWHPETNPSCQSGMSRLNEAFSLAPSTEHELQLALVEHPDARIVAGATDIALEVTQMHKRLPKLIAIDGIASLNDIQIGKTHLTIGAATPYAELESTLGTHFPEFAALLSRLGSRQVRNQGTVGGNIANASPIGDTPPILLALDAEIEIASTDGQHWLPLSRFFVDYKQTTLKKSEYIRAIRIPLLKENQHLKVYKVSKRIEDDISAVLMAINVTIEQGIITAIRSGFGGMAAIPKAGVEIESALQGKPLSIDTFTEAGKKVSADFTPFSDVRASADYRLQVTRGLLQKCGHELMHTLDISRVEQVHAASLNLNEVLEKQHA